MIDHPDWVTSGAGRNLAFSPDGHLYVTEEVLAKIYEFGSNGEFMRSLSVPDVANPGSMTFGPNGNLFIVSFYPFDIVVEFNLSANTKVHSQSMCPPSPAVIRFGPNGHLFVGGWSCDPSGGGLAWIEEWDVSVIPWVKIKEYHGTNTGELDRWASVVFVGEDTMLAANYHPNEVSRIEIFDIPTGAYLGSLVRLPGPHFGGLTIGPDGLLYTTFGVDNQVTKYDPHTGEFLGKVCDGCISPAGGQDLAFFPTSACKITVDLDIKPQCCPNPLEVEDEDSDDNMVLRIPEADEDDDCDVDDDCDDDDDDILSVAILGSASLEVSNIDQTTIKLEGVAPIGSNIEDVATPVSNRINTCDCNTLGPDGFVDLVLHFDAQEVVAALGQVNNCEVEVLTLTGKLMDGTSIEGKDCVRIDKDSDYFITSGSKPSTPTNFYLGPSFPNSFNATTSISYNLPTDAFVNINIYNILGQKVRTLVEGKQTAGYKTVIWDGRSDSGEEVGSGIYLYRIQAGEYSETRKMTLLK